MKKIGLSFSLFAKAFISIYLFIYVFPFPFSYIPYGYISISRPVEWFKGQLNIFFAESLFGFGDDVINNPMNGSGDTTMHYVALASYAILATVGAILLFILLKDKHKIINFYRFMLVYARYFVGLTLVSYGIVKFLIGQFPGPSYFALESTYGEFSPMGLAWRFFGYSDLYKGFMGTAEILAGMLLMIRKTKVLGAFITIGVTINIFLVNLSFDVPVKLFSGHLLFFTILIILPYLKQLTTFFLLNQSAHIPDEQYRFSKKWKKITYIGTKVVLIVLLPLSMIIGHVSSQNMRFFLNEWEGVYEVQSFSIPIENPEDSLHNLQKIIVQEKIIMTIDNKKEKKYYSIENIRDEGEISFIKDDDQEDRFTLIISEKENPEFLLNLKMQSANIEFTTKRKQKQEYLLVNRGFRWVNEFPFNR